MNILLLSSVYPSPDDKTENTTNVVHYFTKEWGKQGHNVKVIHNAHRYPALVHCLPKAIKRKIATKISFYIPDYCDVKKRCFVNDDVQVWRLPILKIIPHGEHSKKVLKRQANEIQQILEREKFRPDIIVGHWMSPQVQLISYLNEIYRCKTAVVLHGREYINNGKFDVTKYADSIDVWGARSKNDAEFIKEALSLNKMPFVCYSGVPDEFIEKYSYDANKFKAVPQEWKFIYVGRLVKYKNIDKILIALSEFKEKDFCFDVIGSGAEEENLKALANELGISDKVVFHGRMPREQVMEYMSKAHCFVMVSKGEIFGLVYLEAMAASCIAIGSRNEGIDGVIEDGKNGLLCEAANAEALTDTLRHLFDMKPEELQELSESGFKTASEFTDSNVAKWYLDSIK